MGGLINSRQSTGGFCINASLMRSPNSEAPNMSQMKYHESPTTTTFEVQKVIQPIYTGGSVGLSRDGRILASTRGEDALLVDVATGEHIARVEGVSSMCIVAYHQSAR